MNIESIYNKLKTMVDDGEESHIIDKTLDNYRLSKEEYSEVFQAIQEYQVQKLQEKNVSELNINIKIFGWTILIVGLSITLGSIFFADGFIVFTYGAITLGLWYLFKKKYTVQIYKDEKTKKKYKSIFDKGLFKKF